MTIQIYLEGKEKVTNLAVANAILEMCEENSDLAPVIIAKAILLQVESEDTEAE